MFRDFLMLLRRYTASSILNIIGMALAFASAYLILVQVNFDMSYNKKIPNAENIYRLENQGWVKEGNWNAAWNLYDPSEICAGIPEIVSLTTTSTNNLIQTDSYAINRNNSTYNLRIQAATCDRNGLEMFGFVPVAGSFDQFIGQGTAIVSASFAQQHGLSVGNVLHSNTDLPFTGVTTATPITIVAIYEDLPSPSDLSAFDMFIGMLPKEQTQPGNWGYYAFDSYKMGPLRKP